MQGKHKVGISVILPVYNEEEIVEDASPSENEIYFIHKFDSDARKPYKIRLDICGTPVNFEIDTGAGLTVISEVTLKNIFGKHILKPVNVTVKTYSNEYLTVLGCIDVAVQHNGKNYLLMVDSYSCWGEVDIIRNTTTTGTIAILRTWFSRYGLPNQLITDNGPQFISFEFDRFCKQNGIKHIRVPAYHQSSNGTAEKFVQTVKKGLKSSDIEKGDSKLKLDNFLFAHRITPTTCTGKTPAELFIGRRLKSRIDLIKPSTPQYDRSKVNTKGNRERKFYENQSVFIRNYRRNGVKWIPAVVIKAIGARCYEVLVNGTNKTVHVDQMIKNQTNFTACDTMDNWDFGINLSPNASNIVPDLVSERRYPVRTRNPLDRYGYP